MSFTDFTDVGFFPLQDHADDGTPVSARFMLAAGRVVSAKKGGNVSPGDSFVEYGKENGLGTLGDVWPWMFWQTRSREVRGMGSWAQAFATVAVGADAHYATIDAQPLRDQRYANDDRYHELRPVWPAAFSHVPRGSILALLPGTEEAEQHEMALWADPRLIAPNARGPGECGTLVVDLQPTAELCMAGDNPGVDGRAARLQTLVRVVAVRPGSSLADLGAEGNVLALNYSRTGADGIPGYGAIFAELDMRTQGPPTGGPTTGRITGEAAGSLPPGPRDLSAGAGSFGADGAQEAAPKSPDAFGRFEPSRQAAHGVGLMAHMGAYGPIHAGAQNDKHHHGTDRDGHPINSAHISVDAYFYRDADHDAPIMFEGNYPHPSPLPIPAPAHISYDGISQHAFAGGQRPGYWRLWCETPDIAPLIPPVEDPPRVPPPPPPITPGGPTTPGPGRGGPGTPGPGSPGAPGPTPGRGRGPTTGGPGRRRWVPPYDPVPPGPNGRPITPNPGGKRFPKYPPTPTGPTTPGPGDPQGPPGAGGGGQPSVPCKTDPPGGPGATDPRGGQPGRTGDRVPPPSGGGAARTPARRGRGGGIGGDARSRDDNDPATQMLPSGSALFRAGGGEIIPRGAVPGGRALGGTTGGDPRLLFGRWAGQSQTTRQPQQIPGVVERIGNTSERRSLYTIFRPMAQGFASLNFRPQLTALGYPNFEHNPQMPAPMFFADEQVRPQVLALHAFGGQSAAEAEWAYVERPEDSRARGGVAEGGILWHPPQYELEDYYAVGSAANVETPSTTSYVMAAPGVAFALGLPTAAGGIAANGVTIAQGAATARPLEIAHNGSAIFRGYDDGTDVVVELARGGHAAIVIPSGTTAQRPATPAAGMVRFNSTTGALEYRGASAWMSLALGDIATLNALGAGAGAGTLAYFDGAAWQLLAPPVSDGYVVTSTAGVLSWVDPNTLIAP